MGDPELGDAAPRNTHLCDKVAATVSETVARLGPVLSAECPLDAVLLSSAARSMAVSRAAEVTKTVDATESEITEQAEQPEHAETATEEEGSGRVVVGAVLPQAAEVLEELLALSRQLRRTLKRASGARPGRRPTVSRGRPRRGRRRAPDGNHASVDALRGLAATTRVLESDDKRLQSRDELAPVHDQASSPPLGDLPRMFGMQALAGPEDSAAAAQRDEPPRALSSFFALSASQGFPGTARAALNSQAFSSFAEDLSEEGSAELRQTGAESYFSSTMSSSTWVSRRSGLSSDAPISNELQIACSVASTVSPAHLGADCSGFYARRWRKTCDVDASTASHLLSAGFGFNMDDDVVDACRADAIATLPARRSQAGSAMSYY